MAAPSSFPLSHPCFELRRIWLAIKGLRTTIRNNVISIHSYQIEYDLYLMFVCHGHSSQDIRHWHRWIADHFAEDELKNLSHYCSSLQFRYDELTKWFLHSHYFSHWLLRYFSLLFRQIQPTIHFTFFTFVFGFIAFSTATVQLSASASTSMKVIWK